MKVVAYLSGVPSPKKNQNKVDVLRKFVNGVRMSGDEGLLHTGFNNINADVGVIQGWVHAGSQQTPHLNLRKAVASNKFNKHTIIIDSNLFNFKPDIKNLHYRRYSLNGVFPTTGYYFTNTVNPNRWKQISNDLNISLKDWRSKGDHILICCQRNGGWSMAGLDVVSWLRQIIIKLEKYTDRPIIVRGHPGDKNAIKYLQPNKYYKISKHDLLTQDLNNAWATITYNSSPGVASAIEGIPLFVTDPTPKTSQAFEVANIDLSEIENPKIFDRQAWIEKLSMCHWKFDELDNGSAWKYMREHL